MGSRNYARRTVGGREIVEGDDDCCT
jgi:hypothetical protein